MTRVGAIDCGTNSIRLLVADVEQPEGRVPVLTDVVREMEIVRLGYGVDRTGRIDPAAMERTLVAARRYAGTCEELGAEGVRFVATSASRDASNAHEFIDGVRAAFASFDIAPEVITGTEEAELSFTGATGDVVAAGHPGPYLVCDIGGGSTELVRGEATAAGARVLQSYSADVGCVRMTERHLASDPPSAAEVAAATADIETAVDAITAEVDIAGAGTLVGLAGSITTVTAHALRLDHYDADRIHLAAIPPERLDEVTAELLTMTHDERAALPFMHPGRVDVIGAGALVWDRVVARVLAASPGIPVVTSEHDILDGIALSAARRVGG
ncbi:exopolyphosphatase [Nostocoides sp. F2B08]|uniref:Ppx/GppA phosphatase family protein n=1 Tax=Nostocoides sp. F2B08 TaxID=2653936 RepID=UPI001262ECAA|nr:exopolyphosphatase [Tetrasphaera sp. F2B08]KAB7743525.1 exopolyphosphatase [Tetrasphaera sp. F2B08]